MEALIFSPNFFILQEKAGYFFCLEDRALLCRNCDVAIHTATPHVSKHQRFLITGVRVEVQPYLTSYTNNSSSSTGHGNSSDNNGIRSQVKIAPTKEKNSKDMWTDFDHAHEEPDVLRSPWEWNELVLEQGSSGLTGSQGSLFMSKIRRNLVSLIWFGQPFLSGTLVN